MNGPAVRTRKVFPLQPYRTSASLDWILGLLCLANILHPESLRFELPKEADDFYGSFPNSFLKKAIAGLFRGTGRERALKAHPSTISSKQERKMHQQANWTRTSNPRFDRENALNMDAIAKTVFAPIYPVIARNAIAATGVKRGVCLDLGSGHAMLALAVAREAPEMEVLAVDFASDCRQIIEANIAEAHLADRVRCAAGDVHALPFEDGSADLIISRGSLFFWRDLKDAFREIYRVLAPGGATYLGGGFGSRNLREQVVSEMLKRDPSWDCYAKKKANEDDIRRFVEMIEEIGCRFYRIIDDETGFWIVLSKPAGERR